MMLSSSVECAAGVMPPAALLSLLAYITFLFPFIDCSFVRKCCMIHMIDDRM